MSLEKLCGQDGIRWSDKMTRSGQDRRSLFPDDCPEDRPKDGYENWTSASKEN
ncbi:hypothetical protein ALC53_13688 [Atta colombica]|uniref:Uncharacterized protein n=1 Tax=Atta colombica TaxID=520822 RepID=A0A195AVH4_9HYME|nr:hypothetical protein ALC53_13688 [Atta colombica]